MPVIQREVILAAATTNPNLFAGSAFEYCRQSCVLSLGLTQSATGMFYTVNVGSDVVVEEFAPVIATRFPIIPDEFFYQDVGAQGDRIVTSARNPTAGALTARAIVMISNL